MRPARARRVQAQRKFAQGAYVPPNVSVAAADTRRDVVQVQVQRNVTINRVSATSLLDVVSLQSAASTPDRLGMHTNLITQPVVLVERLRGTDPRRDNSPPAQSQETVQTRPSESHRDGDVNANTAKMRKPVDPPKLKIIKKQRDYKRVHAMSLRSRRLSKLELNRLIAESCRPARRVNKSKVSSDEDEPLILQVSPRKRPFRNSSPKKRNLTADQKTPKQSTSKERTPKKKSPKTITSKKSTPKPTENVLPEFTFPTVKEDLTIAEYPEVKQENSLIFCYPDDPAKVPVRPIVPVATDNPVVSSVPKTTLASQLPIATENLLLVPVASSKVRILSNIPVFTKKVPVHKQDESEIVDVGGPSDVHVPNNNNKPVIDYSIDNYVSDTVEPCDDFSNDFDDDDDEELPNQHEQFARLQTLRQIRLISSELDIAEDPEVKDDSVDLETQENSPILCYPDDPAEVPVRPIVSVTTDTPVVSSVPKTTLASQLPLATENLLLVPVASSKVRILSNIPVFTKKVPVHKQDESEIMDVGGPSDVHVPNNNNKPVIDYSIDNYISDIVEPSDDFSNDFDDDEEVPNQHEQFAILQSLRQIRLFSSDSEAGPSNVAFQHKHHNPIRKRFMEYCDRNIRTFGADSYLREVMKNTAVNLEEKSEKNDWSDAERAPASCVAEAWSSVQDVLNAPDEQLEKRCKACTPCTQIEKLMSISRMLKTQIHVDGARKEKDNVLPDNVQEIEGTDREDGDADKEEAADTEEKDTGSHIYLDLQPKHASVMMKLGIRVVHGKDLLSVCLAPRSEVKESNQDFSVLEENQLLDRLLDTLSLSLTAKTEDGQSEASVDITETGPHGIDPVPELVSVSETNNIHAAETIDIHETETLDINEFSTHRKHGNERNEMTTQNEDEFVTKRLAEAEQVIMIRMQKEKEVELSRLREKIKANMQAEVEVNRRLLSEVDSMAQALDNEPDAKEVGQEQPSNSGNAPGTSSASQAAVNGTLVEAPVYYPNNEEFQDPIKFYEKIFPEAVRFGICKVVPPPDWRPPCRVHDDIRFCVTNQYISRLFSRWGPAARELSAIKLCLQQQNVTLSRGPLLDGMEVNLPKLYHIVKRYGGPESVINKSDWGKVAEDMKLSKGNDKKLEQTYMKYLLPYDTITEQERQECLRRVEIAWNRKNQKLLDRAMNPLYRQKRMLGLLESSDEEETEDEDASVALNEAEDCIIKGTIMTRAKFKKVATLCYENTYGQGPAPDIGQIEEQYWRVVTMGNDHFCVHTAAVDTGEEGYGFVRNRNEPYGRHPWNPKMVSHNPRNVLRYLGSVLGVTVPTLLLGMLFSTSSWHKDPHTLPWLEFQHKGPTRIWYGIPGHQADNFRRAVETVCPTSCQNKGLWLPSDILMIPPQVLLEHNVTLTRATQNQREFIVSFPTAYTCCISTGYTESESVYFAPPSWLECLWVVFKEARESCEPTMFAMEQLLYNIGKDPKAEPEILKIAQPLFDRMLREEVTNRQMLQERGVPLVHDTGASTSRKKFKNNTREQDECEYCRATLFLSKVKRLTSRSSILCLEHALKLLDTDKFKDVEPSNLEVQVHVSVKELNTVNDDMKRRLGIQPD